MGERRQPATKGEGDREADRRHRKASERFAAEGDVQPAAEEARRALEEDPEDLEEAEDKRIPEEDRELYKRP
jgi:hypothetical protein